MSKRSRKDSIDELLDDLMDESPTKATSDLPFYFEPAPVALQSLNLTPLETQLLSSLLGTFRLGVHISRLSSKLKGKEKLDEQPLVIDQTTDSGKRCAVYIKSALSTHVSSDKKFPLRLTGPSMSFISTVLPAIITSKDIFQLCVFRVFGFGDLSRLKLLVLPDLPHGEGDGNDHQVSRKLESEFVMGIIKGWVGPKGMRILISAYGNFQVEIAKAPQMIALLQSFSLEVALLAHPSASFSSKPSLPTFSSIYELLAAKKIPSLPHGGLLVWLITCDLAEYGLCELPNVENLITHMLGKGTPEGPNGAVNTIAVYVGAHRPDDMDLEVILKNVWKIIENETKEYKDDWSGEPTVIREILKECEVAQKRRISVMDLEHALCKISRQIKKVKIEKSPEMKPARRVSTRKKGKVTA